MIRNRLLKLGRFNLLCRADNGSAIAETALVMPLLLVILVGSVELGDFAYRATEMTNAARAAAQYAAMNGGAYTDCTGSISGGGSSTPCNATSGVVLAAKKDAPKAAATCTNFAVNLSTSCTCTNGGACSTGTGNYTCSGGKPEVLVSVATSADCGGAANVPYFTPFTNNSLTLHGSAQQIVLQ